jgi:hypothetical protein
VISAAGWRAGLPPGFVALAAAVLAVAAFLAMGAPGAPLVPQALASCAEPPPIERELAPGERIVFVGVVLDLASDNRWAMVRVEERWFRAEGLPEIVQVRAGPEPGSATSADRHFERRAYLFFASAGTTYLEDNACSLTQPWSPELARFRPAELQSGPSPDGGGAGPGGGAGGGGDETVPRGSLGGLLVAIFGVTLLLVVALVSVRLLALMRLSRTGPPRPPTGEDDGPDRRGVG